MLAPTSAQAQAKGLNHSSRGQRPRYAVLGLHLPRQGNPKPVLDHLVVPEGPLKIARQFTAGYRAITPQVPKGRLNTDRAFKIPAINRHSSAIKHIQGESSIRENKKASFFLDVQKPQKHGFFIEKSSKMTAKNTQKNRKKPLKICAFDLHQP